jgi:hypothetical protein
MKLQDYIKYYIGCNAITTDDKELADLVGVSDDNAHLVHCRTGSYGTCDVTGVKLLLRRLEDMTEEDLKEMIIMFSLIDLSNCQFEYDQYWVNAIRKGVVVDCLSIEMNGHIDMMRCSPGTNPQPETFHYLLSKHFDLFGLIDAGLAVDQKTLKG